MTERSSRSDGRRFIEFAVNADIYDLSRRALRLGLFRSHQIYRQNVKLGHPCGGDFYEEVDS